MKHSFLFITVPFILLTSSCHKSPVVLDNPYGLPDATQTGAGTFACRINGENYIAAYGIYTEHGGVIGDTLGATGQFKAGRFYYILSFGIFKNLQVGSTYSLSDTVNTYCLFGTDSTCHDIGKSTAIYPHIGTLTITKMDTTHHTTSTNIISGTFNCKVPIPDCDTLDVTDGRFDLSF